MPRHGRPALALAAAILAALPAVASARAPRVVLVTRGPLKGRVAVVAPVRHRADARGHSITIRISPSGRRGHRIAATRKRFRLPSGHDVTSPHRLVLSRAPRAGAPVPPRGAGASTSASGPRR